jgi:16S rRNA (guanine527-N7)-methyltransferase
VEHQVADLATLAARLQRAAGGLGADLDASTAARLVEFGGEVLRWSVRVDLVGRTDLATLLARHVLDSLALLAMLRRHRVASLADLGSGAGFPGLVLAMADRTLRIVSIEPRSRRAAFQRHVIRRFALDRATLLERRFGAGATLDPAPHAIVARAFAALPEYLALAVPLVAPGGLVVAMRGPDGVAEAGAAAGPAAAAGLAPLESVLYELPGDLRGDAAPRGRVLLVYRRA